MKPLRSFVKWVLKGFTYLVFALPIYALLAVALVFLIKLGYMTVPDFHPDDTPNYERTA